ncbi:MAG: hypothetical protein IKO85_05985 [Bacteroidaceae bacterium]|nr:hypothetical protein [Bacteroidaceae bacterium]
MKKIKLLLAVIAAMVTMGVNAQSWTASEVGEGYFMLYNVGTRQYLTRGNGWGTQASITAASNAGNGIALRFAGSGSDFKMFTGINGDAKGLEHLSGGTIYTDQANGKNSTWTFTQVGTDNGPVYTIVSKDNHGGGAGAYLTAGVDGTKVTPGNDGTLDGAKWKLMAIPAQPVGMADASEDNPVDATSLIVNANFSFDAIKKGDGWTMDANNYNPCGGNISGEGVIYNPNAESWRSSFTLSQVLTVPNGIYELTAQAAVTEYTATGANLPVVYAGDQSTPFTAMTEGENSMGGVSTSFTAGKYVVGPIRVVVTNGSLTIGVRGTRTDTWCVWDNFKLTYKGVDLTELKNALQTQIDAVSALEGTTTTAAYNAAKSYADGIDMDALTTEEAISSASTELAAHVNAAKALQTNYANYNAIRSEVLALDDDETIYTGSATIDVSVADAAISQATTVDAVNAAINLLRTAAGEFITSVTVNENKYFDVTNIWVVNPTVSANVDGWNVENVVRHYSWSTGPTTNYGETEFYQSGFDFNQSVTLPAGTWEFGVSGFHRAGTYQTYFYASEDRILLPGENSDVVNSMADAQTYFNNGNGKVALKFLLENESNTIKIGIINEDTGTDRWTIFRNFTLKFYGAPDYSVYADQWTAAVVAANKAKEDHPALIEGAEEYDALEAAINDAPDGNSKKADYLEKIGALEAATSAFIAAAAIYEAYPAALATAKTTVATEDKMAAAVRTALSETIETFDEGKVDMTDKEAIRTATAALNTAVANAEASIANYVEAKAILDAANIYDAAGQASYAANETIATIQAAYDNNTLESVTNEQKAAAQVALATACKAQTQPADGCDMTAYIVNPGIDGNVNGWTCDINANGGYAGGPLKPSNDAMEFWGQYTLDEKAAGKSFDYYQVLSGLPNGAYTISADMLNSTNGEEGASWDGGGKAGLYGKTATNEVQALVTTDGETFLPYTTGEILVVDGELRIGVKNIAALTGRWFACDNFKLTYVRQLTDEDKLSVAKDIYDNALAAAKAIEQGSIPTNAYNSLQEAINENTLESGTADQYNTASTALTEATAAAAAFIEPFAAYNTAKAAADAAIADDAYENVTGAEKDNLTIAIALVPSTAAEYAEAATALTTTTTAFTAAALNYNLYVSELAIAQAISNTITVDAPTTADEALAAFKTLKVAEYTFVADAYPYSATSKIGDFTTWDKSGSVNGNTKVEFELLTSQHWSGTARTYYEQPKGGWSTSGATFTANYQKICTLPAGEYVIKVAARAASGTNTTAKITCSAATMDGPIPNLGDTGKGITTAGVASFDEGEFANGGTGRGFVWNYLPFTLTEETEVTMTVHAEADGVMQWFSVCDGELLSKTNIATAVAYKEDSNNTIEDVDVANVTMTRTIKNGYNTVVLPFDLTSSQVQNAFGEGTEVYAFSENGEENAEDLTINFNKVIEGTISANTPVLVKATKASDAQVFNGVQVVAPTEGAIVAGTNASFVGVWGPTTIGEGHFFIGNGAIYKSAGSTNIKAFRAYILLENPNVTNAVKLFIGGIETSISEINGEAVENDAIYNLSGQRVNKAQKGLYIVNGKKVIIK